VILAVQYIYDCKTKRHLVSCLHTVYCSRILIGQKITLVFLFFIFDEEREMNGGEATYPRSKKKQRGLSARSCISLSLSVFGQMPWCNYNSRESPPSNIVHGMCTVSLCCVVLYSIDSYGVWVIVLYQSLLLYVVL
jgi:hypothetical protein